MQTMPFGAGGSFYAVGCVMEDGTVREFGGTGAEPRTWESVEAFHKARGKLGGTLITYFPPADGEEKKMVAREDSACHAPAPLLQSS